jgi:hypothetical protein
LRHYFLDGFIGLSNGTDNVTWSEERRMNMKRIRKAVTCLCFATTLSASAPCLAESGEASQSVEPLSTPVVHSLSKLDLTRLRSMAAWSAQSMTSPEAPLPLKVQMQTSGGGWSGLSTAKKTWIIVGIVLGAGLVVAAVSNSGGGGGGGGGY